MEVRQGNKQEGEAECMLQAAAVLYLFVKTLRISAALYSFVKTLHISFPVTSDTLQFILIPQKTCFLCSKKSHGREQWLLKLQSIYTCRSFVLPGRLAWLYFVSLWFLCDICSVKR